MVGLGSSRTVHTISVSETKRCSQTLSGGGGGRSGPQGVFFGRDGRTRLSATPGSRDPGYNCPSVRDGEKVDRSNPLTGCDEVRRRCRPLFLGGGGSKCGFPKADRTQTSGIDVSRQPRPSTVVHRESKNKKIDRKRRNFVAFYKGSAPPPPPPKAGPSSLFVPGTRGGGTLTICLVVTIAQVAVGRLGAAHRELSLRHPSASIISLSLSFFDISLSFPLSFPLSLCCLSRHH